MALIAHTKAKFPSLCLVPPSRGIAILDGWVDTSGVRVGATARPPPAARTQGVLDGRPGTPWNPKSLCDQMGRHPTTWDLKTGILRRIPVRFSPDRSPLQSPLFWAIFESQNGQNRIFWEGFKKSSKIAPAGLKWSPRALEPYFPVFSAYFCPIFGPPRAPWAPPGGALGSPGAPLFCIFSLSWAAVAVDNTRDDGRSEVATSLIGAP